MLQNSTWKSHQSFAKVDKKMKIWDQIEEGTSPAASKGSIVWKSVFLQFWNSSCTTQNLEEGSMNTILAHCSRKYHHHSCHDATQAIFDLSLNHKITRIIFRFNITLQRVPILGLEKTALGTIHLRRWQFFTLFWPLPPYCRQFFSTIRRQIWQIFDPSPPSACRRLKWMVPNVKEMSGNS